MGGKGFGLGLFWCLNNILHALVFLIHALLSFHKNGKNG
jgi:hypothetical protein